MPSNARSCAYLFLSLVTGACAGGQPAPQHAHADKPAPAPSESERFNAWLDETFERFLQLSPIGLTFLGRRDRYDELDDASEAAMDKELEMRRASVEEMVARFDYDKLDAEAKTSYDMWKYVYEDELAAVPFRHCNYVFEQLDGSQNFLPTFLISFHTVESRADMQAYISRITAIGRLIDQELVLARKAAEHGVRTPRFALEAVISQSRAVITGAPFEGEGESDLLRDVRQELETLVRVNKLSSADAELLRNAATNALLTSLRPAYERLIAWAEAELPRAPEVNTGVHTLKDGKAYYAHLLRHSTTTDLTPDAVHALGLSEVARIRAEMEVIMGRVGFAGDLQAFFEHVRKDPGNYYPNTQAGRDAYLSDAATAIDNIKRQLPRYFDILPKADLVVRRVEPFRERDGGPQHYYPGTPDGSRPGIYYAHLSDMNAMPKNQLEVIAYHEGIPGHHLQIAIAQERDDLPLFRTQESFTAYAEGWALYAEKLATEMEGTYRDPISDFGRLTTEMWRAVRLVVDTGLHVQGWTEEQAVAYFMANTPEPGASVRSEIQRYLVWPGQATSYKVGMLKLLELRKRAEAALGDRFKLGAFHAAVLGGGALPLGLLEQRVDRWIESQSTGADVAVVTDPR